jgi:predicted DCC family thiol-disulfide oxidoreductase YuxK
MPNAPAFPISVFYDGACIVCSTEIEHYRRKDHANRLILIDISAPDFRPEPFNINLQSFMYELHVIDQRSKVYTGIEAFWAIWQAFPTSTFYGLIGSAINLPGINTLARLFYRGFAGIRKYLPKKNSDCSNGTCRLGK